MTASENAVMFIEIRRETLIKAKRIALRSGKWFKLSPIERLLITLSIKTLKKIRSRILKSIILKILEKISPNFVFKLKVIQIGLEIVKKRIEQATMLGYRRVEELATDINYIMYLGHSYMNTPSIYRAL
mgnify:CR=1 FL=1